MIPSDTSSSTNVKKLALIGLMTAVICIIGPVSIVLPISPVPVSLGSLAVYFAVSVLGMKQGFVSVLLYELLGLMGLPVLSGFTGGVGKVLGPTGGYLIGYLFMALICGYFIERHSQNHLICFAGMFLGTLCCYLFGTLWLAFQASLSFSAAFMAGVLPFIPADIVKLILAMIIGRQLRKRLIKANLI